MIACIPAHGEQGTCRSSLVSPEQCVVASITEQSVRLLCMHAELVPALAGHGMSTS